MAGEWVLAVDGGGTKTAAAVASRRGEVVVLPQGPGCNPQDGPGWDGVLTATLAAAGRGRSLAAAVLGIPGRGEVPAHDAAVDALLAGCLTVPHEAMNDVALAHRGAFGGGAGVLLLAGTGSMAWARGPAGEARVGGWGDAFGDEGSAHWIGREALALASRVLDGREVAGSSPAASGVTAEGPVPASFVQALCDRLGPDAAGPFGPLNWLMERGGARAVVAEVARHVDALADEGSAEAQRILAGAATQLTTLAATAARRTGLNQPGPWVASGSVFRSALVRHAVVAGLGPPVAPRLSTLGGGLAEAALLAGWTSDDAWAPRVDACLKAWA